jgi:hypothetical protein
MTWDDPTYIVHNPWIRGLTLENLRFAFTKPYFSNYLPLHLVSYMVDYQLWGLNPFGFRLQSILLAGLNAALAFALTRRLFGSTALGALAALLYAVHPSHVEAVAWLSIRKDLLSTFFLLAVILYDNATGAVPRAPYAGSVDVPARTSLQGLDLDKPSPPDLTRRWDGACSWKRDRDQDSVRRPRPRARDPERHGPGEDPPSYASQPLSYLMVKGQSVGMYSAPAHAGRERRSRPRRRR